MDDEERNPKLKLLAVILLTTCLIVGITVVVAQIVLNLVSAPVNVTVVDATGQVVLTASSTSLYTGQTLRLTATVSGIGFSKANVPVDFTQDGVRIGTVNTDVNGVAIFDKVVSAGSFSFKANCTVMVP